MTATELVIVWLAVSFGLTALWVGAITFFSGLQRLRRWSQPPDPEAEALDALEEIWRMS